MTKITGEPFSATAELAGVQAPPIDVCNDIREVYKNGQRIPSCYDISTLKLKQSFEHDMHENIAGWDIRIGSTLNKVVRWAMRLTPKNRQLLAAAIATAPTAAVGLNEYTVAIGLTLMIAVGSASCAYRLYKLMKHPVRRDYYKVKNIWQQDPASALKLLGLHCRLAPTQRDLEDAVWLFGRGSGTNDRYVSHINYTSKFVRVQPVNWDSRPWLYDKTYSVCDERRIHGYKPDENHPARSTLPP